MASGRVMYGAELQTASGMYALCFLYSAPPRMLFCCYAPCLTA